MPIVGMCRTHPAAKQPAKPLRTKPQQRSALPPPPTAAGAAAAPPKRSAVPTSQKRDVPYLFFGSDSGCSARRARRASEAYRDTPQRAESAAQRRNAPEAPRKNAHDRTRTCTPFPALVPQTSLSTNSSTWATSRLEQQCSRRDSNPHGVNPHRVLNPARLPIPPPERKVRAWSRGESNP